MERRGEDGWQVSSRATSITFSFPSRVVSVKLFGLSHVSSLQLKIPDECPLFNDLLLSFFCKSAQTPRYVEPQPTGVI